MLKKIFVFLFMFATTLVVYAKEEYVKKILVDNQSLEGFSSDKTTYDIEVDASKDKISINYSYDTDKYQAMGTTGNDISLKSGLNVFKLIIKDKTTLDELITYTLNVTRKDNRSNDNSLSTLTIGGKKVSLNEKNDYTVNVDNSINKVDIKYTLNHEKASSVTGYGERDIQLTGEKTSFPIKIQAENEEVRTYNITVVKTDYKSNDATLKSLKIDKIDFSFKNTVMEYNLDVAYDIENIVITATPNHEKATVEVDPKYNLKVGLNPITITVKAEDGTAKNYKLNITRLEKSYLVNNIEIEGIDIEFDNKKIEYTIKTVLDKLNFKVTLNDENAVIEEIGNDNLKNNNIVSIKVTLDEMEEIYNFKIINDEKKDEDINFKSLEKDNTDTSSKFDLLVFLKKNEMIVSLVVLGIGILSFFMAIIRKIKK